MRYMWIISLFFALTLSACSATKEVKLGFNPLEPLRVAVLPFRQLDSEGNAIKDEASVFLIDNIPGLSSVQEDSPARLVRESIFEHLAENTVLDVLPLGVVDAELVHSHIIKENDLDHERVHSLTPSSICSVMACDAIIRGSVTHWDRSYYGIQSVATVGIKLSILRATDGKSIFTSSYKDSDSRGLSKGPTGYSSILLEPIKGLDSEIISRLANRVSKKAVEPLFVSARPEFLKEPAPVILSVAHDPLDEMISANKPFNVLAYGTANVTAVFSIGNSVNNILMRELAPGHYIGEFYPLKEDMFEAQKVKVSLTDAFGRETIHVAEGAGLTLSSR